MTQCPEIVQTATEGGFPWIILFLVVAIVGGVYVYRNGIVGTEASLKSVLDKLKARAAKIEAKLKAKADAKSSAVTPLSAAVTPPTKAERIAESKALLDAGTITQAQHDAAVATILAA